MSEGGPLDAHAYVDDSLDPAERAAFEAALRRDGKLRARVEAWEAQNEAIRLSFGGAVKPRLAVAASRPGNENGAPPSRPRKRRPIGGKRPKAQTRWFWRAVGASVACVAALTVCGGGPVDPRGALAQRAAEAVRAMAPLADTRLDLASDDPRAVSQWLAPHFAKLDPRRLAPTGWSLLGVRLVPGLSTVAALVLYEDALGGKAGLMLEPTDGTPEAPPAIRAEGDETLISGVGAGFAYAAAGPSRSGVGALIAASRAP